MILICKVFNFISVNILFYNINKTRYLFDTINENFNNTKIYQLRSNIWFDKIWFFIIVRFSKKQYFFGTKLELALKKIVLSFNWKFYTILTI